MKKIIGMIHLAGRNTKEKVDRALHEIDIYEKNGLYGAIIENYHGDTVHLTMCAKEIFRGAIQNPRYISVGINILPNNYELAFKFAEIIEPYKDGFIQMDYVAGKYGCCSIDRNKYLEERARYPDVKVYGGVWPKYYTPVDGSNLEDDLREGMNLCDAIVVSGKGTGMETPIDKIKEFRRIIGNKELIIGAGLNQYNARDQLSIADGVIIGSYFKNGNTQGKVDEKRIREIMDIVKEIE